LDRWLIFLLASLVRPAFSLLSIIIHTLMEGIRSGSAGSCAYYVRKKENVKDVVVVAQRSLCTEVLHIPVGRYYLGTL